MRQIIKQTKILLVIVLLLITAIAFSQQAPAKSDRIVFLNGVVKEGKVTGFTGENIGFIHSGETLRYELSRKEIEKIEYASGRTEQVNEKKNPGVFMKPFQSNNRVAVLPLVYIGDGYDDRAEEMRYRLQEIAINYLHQSAVELKFINPAELNAILLKKGIDDRNIREYTPGELASILNVEYIITGSVVQEKGSLVTVSNHNTVRRQRIDDYGRDRYGREARITRRNNSNSTSVTRQHIETHVSISIYNEAGETVYSKSRQSILTENDAYKNAIQYLLKRTPLYKR
jgi:hypothetical protein